MLIFRVVVAIAWCVLAYVTWQAFASQGGDVGHIFFDLFAMPWPAQFMTDFSIHLIAMGVWVWWRSNSRLIGFLCAVGCLMGGALFSLAYLFIVSFKAENRFDYLLLGKHKQQL